MDIFSDPVRVERVVWLCFAFMSIAGALIDCVDKSKKDRQRDRSWFILAAGAMVVMIAWGILAGITPLIWWKYCFRYCYLSIFPAVLLSAYLIDGVVVWCKWDRAIILLIVLLLISLCLFGWLLYPVVILAYVFKVGEDLVAAIKKWRQNPVV